MKKRRKRKVVNSAQLCDYFGVSAQTILAWRKNRGLPWFPSKKPEFGTRQFVSFFWDEVLMWAKENGVKAKRTAIKDRRA